MKTQTSSKKVKRNPQEHSAGKKTAVTHWVTAVFIFCFSLWVTEVNLPKEHKKTPLTHNVFFAFLNFLSAYYPGLKLFTLYEQKRP